MKIELNEEEIKCIKLMINDHYEYNMYGLNEDEMNDLHNKLKEEEEK